MAYHQFRFTIRPEKRELLLDRLMSSGCLGVIEDDAGVTAFFPDTFSREQVLSDVERISQAEQDRVDYAYSLLPDQDWNESWKKGFKALSVGTLFTILPPWEEAVAGRINLIIDPGMAFGTGHHETTRSCLVLMEKHCAGPGKDLFLDIGTGTGLLAIAAAKLGFKRIVAVDTDPLATEATRMNVGLNGVDNIEVRDGSMDAVSEVFDCITANIISGVLIMLADRIAAHAKPAGIVILSGILAEQAEEVVAAMQNAGLVIIEQYRDDKWVSLVGRKK